jgi:hypothetical protein
MLPLQLCKNDCLHEVHSYDLGKIHRPLTSPFWTSELSVHKNLSIFTYFHRELNFCCIGGNQTIRSFLRGGNKSSLPHLHTCVDIHHGVELHNNEPEIEAKDELDG